MYCKTFHYCYYCCCVSLMACSSCLSIPWPGVPLHEDEERRQRFDISFLWFCFPGVGRKSKQKKEPSSNNTDNFVDSIPSRRHGYKKIMSPNTCAWKWVTVTQTKWRWRKSRRGLHAYTSISVAYPFKINRCQDVLISMVNTDGSSPRKQKTDAWNQLRRRNYFDGPNSSHCSCRPSPYY